MNLFKKRKVYRIITSGGLGDVLLSTPAIRELKIKDKNSKIVIYASSKPHKEVFLNNPYIDRLHAWRLINYKMAKQLLKFKWLHFYMLDYGRLSPSLLFKKSATEIIAEMIDVELSNRTLVVNLTEKEEQEAKRILSAYHNPIVIHVTSRTSKNQEWPTENWVELVKRNPGYTFVQVGQVDEAEIRGAVDLRGATSFRLALALIKNSLSFIGVVSSFAHATSAFDVPGVVFYGPSSPVIWGHTNNINIYRNRQCAPCVDILFNSKCPYDKACMTEISVEEVETALLKQLNSKRINMVKKGHSICL